MTINSDEGENSDANDNLLETYPSFSFKKVTHRISITQSAPRAQTSRNSTTTVASVFLEYLENSDDSVDEQNYITEEDVIGRKNKF